MGMRGCFSCTIMNNVGIGGAMHLMLGSVTGLPPRALNSNPTFLNNIMTAGPEGTMKSTYFGFDGNWTGTLTVDHNNFFGYTSNPIPQTNAISGTPLYSATDWRLVPGSPGLGAGVAVPTVPAFGGGTLDTSKNKDGVTRAAPVNLGIY
jgi:hypothetical protein